MKWSPRDWFAEHLNIGLERKTEIYLELSRSSALGDAAYWLQILFAAGIATLGLVLDSPAVIIGAMLISPLMGPILAAGLALATGDVMLGLRAALNISLSCFLAVGFSMLLVGVLPFKEVTAEIAARIRPTTLDLGVAIFSGAIGSIAICRPIRGVVTSIPGVAIAVALMPPLCVTGYGIGIATSADVNEGWRIASGGSLLFLTNLFAVTFTAMLVFLSLHIDIEPVREQARQWRDQDREMIVFRGLLKYLPASKGLRTIGGLPGRILMMSVSLLMIAFPLSRSMIRINHEIVSRKHENEMRQAATDLWIASFSQFRNGDPRSYIAQVIPMIKEDRATLQLRVFTNKPCSPIERSAYLHDLASRLQRTENSIDLNLIEIPTTTSEILTMHRTPLPPAPVENSLRHLQDQFVSAIESALTDLALPGRTRLLHWQVEAVRADSLSLVLTYLATRDIDEDATNLITHDVRGRLRNLPVAVLLRRIDPHPGAVSFKRNRSTIGASAMETLEGVGRILRREPTLHLEIQASPRLGEPNTLAETRRRAIAEFLRDRWNVDSTRVVPSSDGAATSNGKAVLTLMMSGSQSDTITTDAQGSQLPKPRLADLR